MSIIPLEPDKFYHIYNHAVSKENIFRSEENFNFFLKKYHKYISPIADTFAYCLMPNHFHFAVKIKSADEILIFSQNKKNNFDAPKYVSKQFGNLFSSHAQSFNKQQERKGILFEPNFERKLIETEDYFKQLIHYIHFNAVHHNFVKDLRDWKYSSYESFFSDKSTNLKGEEAIKMFNDKQYFFEYHQKQIDEKLVLEFEFI